MDVDLYLSSFTKISSKWMKDPNLKPEIPKLLKENMGTFKVIDIGKDFLSQHRQHSEESTNGTT